jgi:hypothetical protein
MNWFIKYIFPVVMIAAILMALPVPNSFGAKYRIGSDSDLKSPPAIGTTTPNTGAFSDLTVNGTADFVGVTHTSNMIASTITLGGVPLSAWPSDGNSAGVAQNASDIFLNYLYDQERHGIDSQNMEEGFVGVFANTVSVVDTDKSTGEFYDSTNQLYKPLSGGINQDSDKAYTTESNYLQQEWTNSLPATDQATVTNASKTVTIDTGSWPANAENARISFDSGSTWYDIDARTDNLNIELIETATETTGDYNYIIRMSEFDSGVVKLNESSSFNGGDGRDGAVTISGSKNINTDILGSLRSTNADGISTTVTANPTGSSITVSSITGFADGDKLMLIDLMGVSGDVTDVGNYEILTVSGTPSGNTINTVETISNSYDGTTFSNQKVIVQRIPQWTTVTINSSADLTCNAWNGSSGGLLAFYASGAVTFASGSKIHADGKGYRGASHYTGGLGTTGTTGEGRVGGLDTQSTSANDSGGGAGLVSTTTGYSGGGGAGGYGSTGNNGINPGSGGTSGTGGIATGAATLSQILFGGGGGHGGDYTNLSSPSGGGNGGGIIHITALSIDTSTNGGTIQSLGEDGIQQTISGDFSGSGGGAGGSIFIKSQTLTLDGADILATGGSGSLGKNATGGNGGDGGEGRIRLEYQIINSNPFQNTTEENSVSNPDPGSTSASTGNANVSVEYVSIIDSEGQKTETSAWSDINLSTIDETPASQNIYYWLIFDPASGYGPGTEVKIFDQTDSSWRLIAKKDGSTWKYNSAVSGSETLTDATVNDMLHAVSEAVKLQVANRMTHDDYEAITDNEWETTNGFTTSINNIARGTTLHSSSTGANPSVDRFGINYDGDNSALDLWTEVFTVSSAPTETYTFVADKHISATPTYYVTRDCDAGTPDWTDITADMEVSTTLSDGRSVRRATKDLSATTSGTKLCFRVTVPSGSEYEVSAVGQQARE